MTRQSKLLFRYSVVAAVCFWAVAMVPGSAAAPAADTRWREALRVSVERIRYGGSADPGGLAAGGLVARFYERRSYMPEWRDAAKIEALAALIAGTYADGLNPADYHRQAIETWLREQPGGETMTPAEWAVFELRLTDGLIGVVHDLLFGKVDPLGQHPSWNVQHNASGKAEILALVEATVDAPSLRTFIADHIQRGAYYQRLRAALARYRAIAAQGGWSAIAAGPSIERGKPDDRIPALAARLAIAGDLDDADRYAAATAMDELLEAAVRRFQDRHGLEADGVVGPATRNALNVSVEQRIRQLRLALERARWVLGDLGGRYLVANIAGFRVYLVAGGQIAWDSRIVVGKAQQQTPVFRRELQYLVFNPSWRVPYGIATREFLPEITAQANWFQTHDFEVRNRAGTRIDPATVDWAAQAGRDFQYLFVQPPGPNNALGQVKFMFPNRHNVYLHDTPARQLFSEARRTFSHGCVRVEDPLALAELLLRPQGWDRERIDAALASGQTTTVRLTDPLPVLLLYSTANVDPDGTVHFYPDVYGRDSALAAALDGPFLID